MGGSLDAAGSGGGGADSGTGSGGGGDGTSLGVDSVGAAKGAVGVGWTGDGVLADDSLCGVSEVPTESGAGSIEIMIGVS